MWRSVFLLKKAKEDHLEIVSKSHSSGVSITREERIDIRQTKTTGVYYNRLLNRSQERVPTECKEKLSPDTSCYSAS